MAPLVGMTVHGIALVSGKPFTIKLGAGGRADAEWQMAMADGTFREQGRWWIEDNGLLCVKFVRFAFGELRCRRLVREGDSFRGMAREERFGHWTIK
jgi:hypothetical protein